MGKRSLYVSITNHGFGHTTRATSVAATVKQLAPDIDIILATTAPRWLLESYFSESFTHREIALDIGVIQPDSLTMDKTATLAALQEIQQKEAVLVETEAAFLKAANVGLVLADIPPLAAKVAKTVRIPCWMMSNFGWDFIYRPWGGEFIEIADWIADCFAQCDRLFRLPFHEPMSAFPSITDVGLTGGTPKLSEDELRSRFQLSAPRAKTILLTFGGLGLAKIPYENLKRFSDWQFITFDRAAPDLPNLCKVSDLALRPVDFMPLCDRVVSKPGFSTFSEACRLDIPIVTVTRDDFAEGPVLVNALKDHSYHQVMTPKEFAEGSWDFLKDAPVPPRTNQRLSQQGNEEIGRAIVDFLKNFTG
ncbi:glycosyl transferase [Oscillatoria sp. CS-180]|uniref:glycosyl transferase n=1 Tax=Oscillatoria sp. CS-180 TaxID=3021720 RepID=UPI00232F88C3|nr:glycosyl transferase [Oscillatoria sp. CS-180]MDB9525993.1 glycosyl transferase [Oscillatoria sp. CS-180]